MSYIPAKYFGSATTIVAADLQENLDRFKEYVSGSVRASDLKQTNWAGPRHIVRGKYDPIVNSHKFASGVSAYRNSEPNETSWVSRATTGAASGSTVSFSYMPNTGITFYLDADAYVIMQFYASPVNSLASGTTYIYIYVDGTDQITMTRNAIRNEGAHPKASQGYGIPSSRNNFAGYHMTSLSSGKHSLTLKAYSDAPSTFLCNWGVSIEAYYK